MKNLTIEQVSEKCAKLFWQESPHATVFTCPDVLVQMSKAVDWWICRKGNQPLCLWPVCLSAESIVKLPGYSYFVGPMLSFEALMTPPHRRLALDTAIFEGLIMQLSSKYGAIEASLPIGIDDVRVFDWWNYNDPNKNRIRIQPRYTARIVDLQTKTMDEVASAYRELRRRELRKIERGTDFAAANNCSALEITDLYAEVMQRQGLQINSHASTEIETLISLVRSGFGYVTAYRDKSDSSNLAYVALVLYAKNVANLILNVVGNQHRSSGLPAAGITMAIRQAKELGCDVFDFNGANSPNRGDDKHSYGAVSQLYFDLRFFEIVQ